MSRMDGDGLGLHDEDGYYNDDDENLSDTDPEDDEWETAAVQQICSYGVCVCVCVCVCVSEVCVCVCVRCVCVCVCVQPCFSLCEGVVRCVHGIILCFHIIDSCLA